MYKLVNQAVLKQAVHLHADDISESYTQALQHRVHRLFTLIPLQFF